MQPWIHWVWNCEQFMHKHVMILQRIMYSLLFSFNIFWGFIRFLAEIVAYKGIDYSSPTLASVIGNLTPALTFMLAIFFRFTLSSSSNFHHLPLLPLHHFSFLGCLCNCNSSVSLHRRPCHRKRIQKY